MEAVFLKIVNMSINAGWLVLAVLAIRLLLKRAPKSVMVMMWALVGIRLIWPSPLKSVFSLIPSTKPINTTTYMSKPYIQSGIKIIDDGMNGYLAEHYMEGFHVPTGSFHNLMRELSVMWIVGMVAMLLYSFISCLSIRKKVREATLMKEQIWLCDHISSPFIFGIVRPRIYLPSDMCDADMEYVIAHEKAHLKRYDHLWKPLGFLLLTVYWFHPLLWVAYVLLCRDIEFACDEKVIKEIGSGIKKSYAEALINCSVPRKMIAVCPLAFGEVGVKERIKKVLNYKKPAFWTVIIAVVACVALAVGFLTNPGSQLQKKYPQYFNLDASEGLEVYIWQMSEDSYYCGLLSGSTPVKSEMDLWNLEGTTMDEMREILSTYNIAREDITLIPYIHPLSSYWGEIDDDDDYQEKLEEVFWGK